MFIKKSYIFPASYSYVHTLHSTYYLTVRSPAAGNNVAEPVLHPGVLRLSLHIVQQGLGKRVHQNQAPNILQENWKKFIYFYVSAFH